MRCFLVASFFADVTQHIHSLRAKGVISIHTFFTVESDSIAFRKSIGILCMAPPRIKFLDIKLLYQTQLYVAGGTESE